MRESTRMEQYAQRAVERRRTEEDSNRKIGAFLMLRYVAQGEHLCEALKKLSPMERQIYIAKHTELIVSSDGAEGINVVWCPNSQVITHRLLSLEMRKQFDGQHYLSTWVRRVPPQEHNGLRASLSDRLEKRVAQRLHQKNQLAFDLSEVKTA